MKKLTLTERGDLFSFIDQVLHFVFSQLCQFYNLIKQYFLF